MDRAATGNLSICCVSFAQRYRLEGKVSAQGVDATLDRLAEIVDLELETVTSNLGSRGCRAAWTTQFGVAQQVAIRSSEVAAHKIKLGRRRASPFRPPHLGSEARH
jgi:hypothetical protein